MPGRTGRIVRRSLALAALGAALGQFHAARSVPGGPVAVFVDVSASQRGLPDRLAWPAETARRIDAYTFAGQLARPGQEAWANATRAEPVLSLLAARPTAYAAAVVVSDGRFQDAEALAGPARQLGARGLPVFMVPRAPRALDARVVDLTARADEQGRVHLSATVIATGAARRTLRLWRQGLSEPLGLWPVELPAELPLTVRAVDPQGGASLGIYRAELAEPDLLAGNNALETMAHWPQGRLLWAGVEPPPPIRPGGRTIIGLAPSSLPDRLDLLLPASAIVVADANGRALSAAQRQALADYARAGGGVIMIGTGPYAAPADRQDPLNAVLPLVAEPTERGTLAVDLVLDASGSMGEPSADGRRFDAARQAALAVARRQMDAGDYLRVITFSAMARRRFAAALTPESLRELDDVLANVQPSGGTRIEPALELVERPARPEDRERVILILSDLQTEPLPVEAWAQRLARTGAALAVVAVGPAGQEGSLERLAGRLNAPFVRRDDLEGLAEVFDRLLSQARVDALVRRPTALRMVDPAWTGDGPPMPPLDAYLTARADPSAEVLGLGPDDRPLLARRRVGAGRTVGLAWPVEGPYNRLWRGSPSGLQMLSSAMDWAAAPGDDPRLDVQYSQAPAGLTILVRAVQDAHPVNDLELSAERTGPDGQTAGRTLTAVAPGTYTATLGGEGPAMVFIRDAAGQALARGVVPGRYDPELARLGVDREMLARLAEWTGGRVCRAEDLPGLLGPLGRPEPRALWPVLLLTALGLMLADWLIDRQGRAKKGPAPVGSADAGKG